MPGVQSVETLLQSADCVLARHEQLSAYGPAFPWGRFSLLVQLVGPTLEVVGTPPRYRARPLWC